VGDEMKPKTKKLIKKAKEVLYQVDFDLGKANDIMFKIVNPEWDKIRWDIIVQSMEQEERYNEWLNQYPDVYGYNKTLQKMNEYFNKL
jgi:hypothetical protein